MADWAASVVTDTTTNTFKEPEHVPAAVRKQFDDVFRRFSAIHTAIENIQLSYTFIRARRPQRKDIRLDQYLAYHIAAYIQEIYILSERLEFYAKVMMRRKKRAVSDPGVEKRFAKIVEQMRTSFKNIVLARGSHVHDRPFDDGSLEPLSTYALLGQRDAKFAKLAATHYSTSRRTWVERLESNKTTLDPLLDAYFDFMYEELVASWAEMLPNNSFKPKPLRGSA